MLVSSAMFNKPYETIQQVQREHKITCSLSRRICWITDMKASLAKLWSCTKDTPTTCLFEAVQQNYTTVDPKQLHKSHMKFWRQTQSTDTPDQWDKSSSLQNDKGLWTLPNLVGPTMFLVYDPFCSTIFMPF